MNPENTDPKDQSIDNAVRFFEKAGMPKEKIIVGIAFYGRAYKGVEDGGKHGLFQKFTDTTYVDGISWPDMKNFLKEGSGFTRYWDDVAKVPYLYNGDMFITYVDQQAVEEVGKYAKENNLGGVMVWEYGHDLDCVLFDVLKKSVQ